MYKFSISPDKKTGESYGIKNLELCDKCLGKVLAEMSGAEIEALRNKLINNLERVVLYTVKIPVSDYAAYVKFFRNAHLINVENVKLAYSAIDGASDDEIKKIIAIGAAFSIRVVFEFKAKHIEQFSIERYMGLRSEATGVIFNPDEFVKLHKNPYLGILYKAKYKDDIVMLRVCDMLYDSLTPMLPEKGHSEIKECASNLLSRSFNGYFSFKKYSDDIAVPDVIKAFCFALCNM